MKTSDTIGELAKALASAQAEMGNVAKNKKNPHFKSNYADLAAITETVMPVLAKFGLSVVQLPCNVDDGVGLTTRLMHQSGEWLEETVACNPGKAGPQPLGSVITYLRRYALAAVTGVAQEDDDGNSAQMSPMRRAKATESAENIKVLIDNTKKLIDDCSTEEELGADKILGVVKTHRGALGDYWLARREQVRKEVAA